MSDNCVVTCCVKLIKQCNDFFHLYSMPVWKTVSYQTIYFKFYQILLNMVDMLYADVFVQDLFLSSLYFCSNICLSLSYLYYLFLPSW